MMGHNSPAYQSWIEALGYNPVKQLKTYELDITNDFPPLLQRIIQSGEKNPRISIRKVDKSRFDEEAAIILSILHDSSAERREGQEHVRKGRSWRSPYRKTKKK